MTIKERLLHFISSIGSNKNKFEKSIGRSTGFVNNIGEGINVESLDKIKKVYPELNTEWLLTGKGDMMLTKVVKDPGKETSAILELTALTNVLARNLAKVQAKLYGRGFEECLDEFEQDVHSEMRRLVNNK